MIKWNSVLTVFLCIYVFQSLFDLWLEKLNRDHLTRWGDRVPDSFRSVLDAEKLGKMRAYAIENSNFDSFQTLVSDGLLIALIVFGFFPGIERLIEEWGLPLIPGGLFFMLVAGSVSFFISLPFDYMHTFGIEQRFGFNQSTLAIWVSDHIKAAIVNLLLVSILVSALLWTIETFPDWWWLAAFVVISGIQLLLSVLYPIMIAPLFNKFEPLKDQELAQKVRELTRENGIRVKKILQMDAGKRSRHTNAYFTGFGRAKRVVLFDTLLKSHSQDEILAVLAHEIGHYKGLHIWKQLGLFEAAMFVGLYVTHCLLDQPQLYSGFGFETMKPYVGLFFLGIFWQKAGFFLSPLYMALSRRFERAADLFAVKLLKSGKPMAAALKRLGVDNLSNLTPHPMCVRFHYSHPPLVERVEALEKVS